MLDRPMGMPLTVFFSICILKKQQQEKKRQGSEFHDHVSIIYVSNIGADKILGFLFQYSLP